jgi:hypothetical protein
MEGAFSFVEDMGRRATEDNGTGFAGFAAAETEDLVFANEYLENNNNDCVR